MIFLLKSLRWLVEAIDALSIFAFAVVLAPPVLMLLNPGVFILVMTPVQSRLDPLEAPLARLIHAALPYQFGRFDATPYFISALLLLFSWACKALTRKLRVDIMTLEELETVAEAQEAARNADVGAKLAAIAAASPSEREEVLEVYTQARRILEGQKRELSFLAVDVVNSTGMKQGEDPAVAERDFRQYRKLVEGAIAPHKPLKAAWTPDGVMICFSSLPDAVHAAQSLIVGLEDFNRRIKAMRAEFKVRCGVNSGAVMYDDSLRMEEMADAAIDLTGHMQKYAEPNTIYAAKNLIASRGTDLGFVAVDKKVDGCEVCAWPAG